MSRPLPFIGKEPPREMLVWLSKTEKKKRMVVHVIGNGTALAVENGCDYNHIGCGDFCCWPNCEDTPEEKLVPWEFEEVPLDAWYKIKNGLRSGECGISKINGICPLEKIYEFSVESANCKELFEEFLHTFDDPRSHNANWQPCGKKISV